MVYKYQTCCVNSTAEKIDSMVDNSREVTWSTFRKYIDIGDLKALFPVYSWGERGGLHIQDDYAVSYYYSTYDGVPCYYVTHSCIEYIFTKEAN